MHAAVQTVAHQGKYRASAQYAIQPWPGSFSYNALPCNFGFLALLHLRLSPLEDLWLAFQLKIASLAKTSNFRDINDSVFSLWLIRIVTSFRCTQLLEKAEVLSLAIRTH
jgi:hypothetical protein